MMTLPILANLSPVTTLLLAVSVVGDFIALAQAVAAVPEDPARVDLDLVLAGVLVAQQGPVLIFHPVAVAVAGVIGYCRKCMFEWFNQYKSTQMIQIISNLRHQH